MTAKRPSFRTVRDSGLIRNPEIVRHSYFEIPGSR
jgi:hypothetical protein